jgi:GNAT superfamily N-acetyltransferase
MLIEPLADCAEAVPMLAQWFCDEWPYEERSPGTVEAQLRENLNRDRLPITWIYRSGADVIGTVSLDLSDLPLPAYSHLSPWLASLYVIPSARGRGVGLALVNYLLGFARRASISTAYLWTPGSTKLYEKCGWKIFDTSSYAGHPITLMQIAP